MTKKPDAFVALAGPEMLGEGPLFSPVSPSKFNFIFKLFTGIGKNLKICMYAIFSFLTVVLVYAQYACLCPYAFFK